MEDQHAPLIHTIDLPEPHTHYARIETRHAVDGAEEVVFSMAVWTPGSYLVREYSRHVEELEARTPDGAALPVRKVAKNRWRVECSGAGEVIVGYRLWCRDMSVRGNWVDDRFALLNGAPTFLVPSGAHALPHVVRLRLPEGWAGAWCALEPIEGEDRGGREDRDDREIGPAWRAGSYDELVDSPILAGSPEVLEFEEGGRVHHLLNQGGGEVWDGPRSAEDTRRIVRSVQDFWGEVPYREYWFFNLITEGRGGLEHRSSTVLMTSRWRARDRKQYLGWLGLVSHEFFHTWNVKRLRPIELGPFDYEREAYTRSLWVAEGITNYYTDLLVHRAGLSSAEEYLEALSSFIERLQTAPGRLRQSLEDASFDAWIKLYRPDENSVNSSMSYYVKGAVVAFLLDARVRRRTGGERSLDDVMRLAYRRFSGNAGFTADRFSGTLREVSGFDPEPWLEHTLRSTEELDYTEALETFGLRFAKESGDGPRRDGPDEAEAKAWMGLVSSKDPGRLVVKQVLRDSPAHRAGIDPHDEIVAIDGYRVTPEDWPRRLEAYRPDDRLTVLVARRQEMRSLDVTLGSAPRATWRLESDPEASTEQQAAREAWLATPDRSAEKK